MAFFNYKKIDVEDFLNELGLSNISKKGNQFWFSCPLDGHIGMDRTPSASMEIGTTRMHCFGCGYSGNAVSFLAKIEGVSHLKARKWLRERFGMSVAVEQNEKFGEILKKRIERSEKARLQKTDIKHNHSIILDDAEVDKRSINWYKVWDAWQGKIESAYPLAYMLDRGFHPDTLTEWAIGWDMISQRICIPIRDDLGNLVGFKGRAVDFLPKYLVLGGDEYGFETYNVSKILFGLDKAQEYITDSMIVVEGELNALSMHQRGYKTTVGISGRTLSDNQIKLIKKYCNKVTFIFDETRDTLNAARELERSISVDVVGPHDKDPADMTSEEVKKLLDGARSSIVYDTMLESL